MLGGECLKLLLQQDAKKVIRLPVNGINRKHGKLYVYMKCAWAVPFRIYRESINALATMIRSLFYSVYL